MASRAKQMDETLSKVLRAREGTPKVSVLWRAIEEAFGGPERFAEEIKTCYDEAPPGSPTRARMMSLLIELHAKAAEEDAAGNPYDTLTADELNAAMAQVLADHAKNQPQTGNRRDRKGAQKAPQGKP